MINLIIKRIFTYLSLLLAYILMAACGTTPPDDILEKSSQASIVFVKENSHENNRNSAMRSNADEYYPGSDICTLSPVSIHGTVTNLTKQYTRENQNRERDYGAAADPEVSYDGKKILFSMRKNRDSRWHLYEMNIDGSDLNQLTSQNSGDDMDPVYLPNGQIIFTSTRSGIVDEYERRGSPLLHVADRTPDGRLTNIRQISFNQSHDTNPFVHSSGKVIFSRWEHLGDPNKFPLFVINPDGTRLFVMYGNHSPRESGSRTFLEPRELADGGIVCSVMERTSPFEGGAIAIIDISKSDDNLKFISPKTVKFNNTNQESSALFKTPHPIFDDGKQEKILVSVSPIPVNDGGDNQADYGIYVMDKNGSNLRLLYNDPEYNEVDPVPVLPKEKVPAGVPQVMPTDPNVKAGLAANAKTGMFFDGNVYDRSPSDGQLRPDENMKTSDGTLGQAKFIRVLEAIGIPQDRNERGAPIGDTNFEKQRVVGYAPVRSDGSFSIEVPANRSIHVQTLDENGLMLVNQLTWIQVMPGEKRLCTGCHDSHDRDRIINDLHINGTGRVENTALAKVYQSGFDNAVMVSSHPSARTDTVDFFDRFRLNRTNTIQAVFEAKCVSCHNNTSSGGGLSLENTEADLTPNDDETTLVYEALNSNDYHSPNGDDIEYTSSRGARNSPLIWVQFGRQLNRDDNRDYRNLNYDHTELWPVNNNGIIDPFLPENKELLMMIEWLDAGAQYSNSVSE